MCFGQRHNSRHAKIETQFKQTEHVRLGNLKHPGNEPLQNPSRNQPKKIQEIELAQPQTQSEIILGAKMSNMLLWMLAPPILSNFCRCFTCQWVQLEVLMWPVVIPFILLIVRASFFLRTNISMLLAADMFALLLQLPVAEAANFVMIRTCFLLPKQSSNGSKESFWCSKRTNTVLFFDVFLNVLIT